MSDHEVTRHLMALDPDQPSPLDPNLRAELAMQRNPTTEDLEPGEIFDPITQAYADPGWTPIVDWSGTAPLSEDDLEEINNLDL